MGWGTKGVGSTVSTAEQDAGKAEQTAKKHDDASNNTPSGDQTHRTDGKTNGGNSGNKDANDSEGQGVDVSPGSTPPAAGTHDRDVYDAKLRLVEEGKAAGMQAEQLLNSTLAQIKDWAKQHESDGDF